MIDSLFKMVEGLNSAVPKLVLKLNTVLHPKWQETTRDVQGLRRSTEEFMDQVGVLDQTVASHGSLAEAVSAILLENEATAPAVQGLEGQLEALAEEVASNFERHEHGQESLMSLVDRVSASSTKRLGSLTQRVSVLEGNPPMTSQSLPTLRIPVNTGGSGVVDMNTPFGNILVGSTPTTVTMTTVFDQIKALETKMGAALQQSSFKNKGVVFQKWAFGSETEFKQWYLADNPSGGGPSAFVDLVSIWAFATSESGTAKWLTEVHRSKAVGFRASPDTLYAHSMMIRYPKVFVGKAEAILSSHIIHMLTSTEAWRGNGMGDGHKDKLMEQLNYAVQSHTNYCEDFLPDGPVRMLALKTAAATQLFFQAFASYMDEELTMLNSFGLPEKQSLLLLSQQVVHICDDLFESRNQASGVDLANRLATATRYAWASLQALGSMEGYLRAKFRKHPGINSTYMRFLTRNLADQSSMGLKSKVEALSTKITKVETAVGAAATKSTVEKLDTKVEMFARANNWKRTGG